VVKVKRTRGLLRAQHIKKRRNHLLIDSEEQLGSSKTPPAVLHVVGYKNSGKTTLICALIPLLRQRGYTVAVIKHDTHGYDLDHQGTDTWRHREAGASGIAITNNVRTVRMEERGSELPELIASFVDYDYIFIEGFKNEGYPKFVLIHEAEDLQLLHELSNVSAALIWPGTSNETSPLGADEIEYFDINDTAGINGRFKK